MPVVSAKRSCCIGRCSFDHETLNGTSHLDNWRWTRSDLSGRPLLAILRQAAHGWWIRSGGSAKARVRACAGSSLFLWGIRPGRRWRAGQLGDHGDPQAAPRTPRTPIAPRNELNGADFFAGAWASLMPVGGWPTEPNFPSSIPPSGARVRHPEWQSHRPASAETLRQMDQARLWDRFISRSAPPCSLIFSVPSRPRPITTLASLCSPRLFLLHLACSRLCKASVIQVSPSTPSFHRSACMPHLTCTLLSYLRNLTFPAYVPLSSPLDTIWPSLTPIPQTPSLLCPEVGSCGCSSHWLDLADEDRL